jgi:hypothetical protein
MDHGNAPRAAPVYLLGALGNPVRVCPYRKHTNRFPARDELGFWSLLLIDEELEKLYNGGAGSQILVK